MLLLFSRSNRLLFGNYKCPQRIILTIHARFYEGKPFDERNRNWADQQEKNREYDINQNIHDFRRKEELKMKDKYIQNKAAKRYQKHRSKMEQEYKINEQWRQQRETQRAKEYNVQNFTFDATEDDIPKNNTNSTLNAIKYAMFGVAVAGIGFLFINKK